MGGASIERVQPGDHACLVFTDSEERLDIVAAFVRDGLRDGQKVICLTEAISQTALTEELARRGLKIGEAAGNGQLYVGDSGRFFVPHGSFNAERTIGALREQLASAGREGYQGLRITSDMCWATRPVDGLADLPTYELQLTALLTAENATAVCQYDRQCFDTVTMSTVLDAHCGTVAAITYHDDAMLRICRQHVPSGIRVAGEIDYRAVDALTSALTESLNLDNHIDVNLTQLRFLDTIAAGVLIQAAAGLSPAQSMTVRCLQMPYKILAALGLRDIPAVTLQAVEDDD